MREFARKLQRPNIWPEPHEKSVYFIVRCDNRNRLPVLFSDMVAPSGQWTRVLSTEQTEDPEPDDPGPDDIRIRDLSHNSCPAKPAAEEHQQKRRLLYTILSLATLFANYSITHLHHHCSPQHLCPINSFRVLILHAPHLPYACAAENISTSQGKTR